MSEGEERQVAKAKVSTWQRVLNVSSELFNNFGIEAVSLGQIAETMAISPGNLTYHFKKKSDLVAAHIAQFEEATVKAVEAMPMGSSGKEFSQAYMQLLELTLSYKFLFVGANYIIQNDLISAKEYEKLINNTKAVMINQFQALIDKGYMHPMKKPMTLPMLIDGVWWQWLGWLLAMQIEPSKAAMPDRKTLVDGAIHILFLSQHYLEPDYFLEIHNELLNLAKPKRRKSAETVTESV